MQRLVDTDSFHLPTRMPSVNLYLLLHLHGNLALDFLGENLSSTKDRVSGVIFS